jgi:hypothetical protein
MTKTMALLFVLGLMMSCASHRTERGISSEGEPEVKHGYYERSNMGSRY